MIRVPLTQSVRPAGQLAPSRALNEGTREMSAFDGLAQAVGDIGQGIFNTQVKLKRIENERRVNELKAGMRKTQADFQNSLLNDHNPETWNARHKQAMDGYLSSAGIDSLPPEAREAWDDWAGDFQGNQSLQITRDAAVKGIRRSEEQLQNNLSGYVENKNFAAAREEVEGSSLLSPEEKVATLQKLEKQEKKTMERERIDGLNAGIMANPFEMEERINAGEFDDIGDLPKQQAIARLRTAKNQVTGDAIDAVKDGMADGSITKPEQIDEMFPGVPARYRESLKLDLAQRAARMEEAERATPEYQAQTVGSIAGLLEGLEGAEPDDFADRYSKASFLIDGLPDSPTKRRLDEELAEMKSGRKEAATDAASVMRAQLKEALPRILPDLKAEPYAQEMSIQKAVSDGILKDKRKLGKMFFGDEEVQQKILDVRKGMSQLGTQRQRR